VQKNQHSSVSEYTSISSARMEHLISSSYLFSIFIQSFMLLIDSSSVTVTKDLTLNARERDLLIQVKIAPAEAHDFVSTCVNNLSKNSLGKTWIHIFLALRTGL
jgi:hypothetical protein